MDHEAVKLWRDHFHLNLSASWKHDVEKTITDLDLWAEILANWKYKDSKGKWRSKAPGIKPLLDEYERQRSNRLAANEVQSRDMRDGSSEGFRVRSGCPLPRLLQGTSREYGRTR